jgi:hypothetical protein
VTAQHVYRPGNQWGVTVPELIARIAAEGLPVRLTWPANDPDQNVRPVPWHDDAPTGWLPKISDAG